MQRYMVEYTSPGYASHNSALCYVDSLDMRECKQKPWNRYSNATRIWIPGQASKRQEDSLREKLKLKLRQPKQTVCMVTNIWLFTGAVNSEDTQHFHIHNHLIVQRSTVGLMHTSCTARWLLISKDCLLVGSCGWLFILPTMHAISHVPRHRTLSWG